MSVEVGAVYAGKFDFAANGDTTAAAHACTVDHDGVQADNGLDAVRFCGEADKFHHGDGADGNDSVVLVASFDEGCLLYTSFWQICLCLCRMSW